MTDLAVVLVVTCLAAGLWATWREHVERRRERADSRMVERLEAQVEAIQANVESLLTDRAWLEQ